jgi:hypothetical protein
MKKFLLMMMILIIFINSEKINQDFKDLDEEEKDISKTDYLALEKDFLKFDENLSKEIKLQKDKLNEKDKLKNNVESKLQTVQNTLQKLESLIESKIVYKINDNENELDFLKTL